jgi:hypothetical protein
MKKSELKRIIQEELKGYSKYAPGGETKGGTTDDFRNILTTIAKSVPKEDSEEETVSEEASNIQRLDISYTFPNQRFYSINVDNKKISNYEEASQIINSLTGLELPERADYTDPEVYKIVDALKAKGIQAGSYEMDIT